MYLISVLDALSNIESNKPVACSIMLLVLVFSVGTAGGYINFDGDEPLLTKFFFETEYFCLAHLF